MFAGTTQIYGNADFGYRLASQLQGFPKTADDRREIELGSSSERVAGGWLRIECVCLDRAGHAVMRVELKTKDDARPRMVVASLYIEAPAIDRFVTDLENWEPTLGSSITLMGAA